MSKESLFLRLLTSEAQIDSHRLMSGAIGQKDYGRISHALETLSAMRLFIDDTASISVLEMRAKARRLQAEHGLSLHRRRLHPADERRAGVSRIARWSLASISRSLKGLAKELNVPIVVLSQLSRAPESRSDHRPQLSDLRESGALEQDADVVDPDLPRRRIQPRPESPGRGHRGAHPRQAAQRAHRCRDASRSCASRRASRIWLPPPDGVGSPHFLTMIRSTRSRASISRRCSRTSAPFRGFSRALPIRANPRSLQSSKRMRTVTDPSVWRWLLNRQARRCSRAPISRKASC